MTNIEVTLKAKPNDEVIIKTGKNRNYERGKVRNVDVTFPNYPGHNEMHYIVRYTVLLERESKKGGVLLKYGFDKDIELYIK